MLHPWPERVGGGVARAWPRLGLVFTCCEKSMTLTRPLAVDLLYAQAHDLGQLKDRTAEHGGPGIPCVVYESAEAAAPGAPAALMKGRRVSWLLPSGHAGACVLDAAPGSAVMHRPDRFGWGVAEKVGASEQAGERASRRVGVRVSSICLLG